MALDIKDSIEKTWTYIVPAIFETSILVFITLFVLGASGVRGWLEAIVTNSSILTNSELIKVLETYGITKIMPLAVLFIILMLCYSISRVSHSMGNLIGINYTRNPLLAFFSSENRWPLTEVLQYYPSITETNDSNFILNFLVSLNSMLDERVDRAEIEGNSSFYSLAVGAKKAYRNQKSRFAFVKFTFLWLMVFALALLIYGNPLRETIGRMVVVSLALLIAAYVLLKNQSFYSVAYSRLKILALKAELESQYTTTKAPDLSRRGEIVQNIKRILDTQSQSLKANPASQPSSISVGRIMVYPWALFGVSLTGKPTILARIRKKM